MGSGEQPSPHAVGSPISQEASNIISVLHAKLAWLEAYREYARTDGNEIWDQLTELDTRAIGMLADELEWLVQQGRLRVGPNGRTE